MKPAANRWLGRAYFGDSELHECAMRMVAPERLARHAEMLFDALGQLDAEVADPLLDLLTFVDPATGSLSQGFLESCGSRYVDARQLACLTRRELVAKALPALADRILPVLGARYGLVSDFSRDLCFHVWPARRSHLLGRTLVGDVRYGWGACGLLGVAWAQPPDGPPSDDTCALTGGSAPTVTCDSRIILFRRETDIVAQVLAGFTARDSTAMPQGVRTLVRQRHGGPEALAAALRAQVNKYILWHEMGHVRCTPRFAEMRRQSPGAAAGTGDDSPPRTARPLDPQSAVRRARVESQFWAGVFELLADGWAFTRCGDRRGPELRGALQTYFAYSAGLMTAGAARRPAEEREKVSVFPLQALTSRDPPGFLEALLHEMVTTFRTADAAQYETWFDRKVEESSQAVLNGWNEPSRVEAEP